RGKYPIQGRGHLLSIGSFRRTWPSHLDETDIAGTEGKSVTFHLRNVRGENLAWSFRGETILVIKLGASPELLFSDESFASRVAFPNNGSSLTISQLRRSDAGTYLAKNNDVRANFTLHVYRECLLLLLQEPTVSCTEWNCSAEGCSYVLHCAVDPPGDSSFFWSYNGEPTNEGSEWEVVEKRQHPGEDPDLLPYTCTAQNPVSSRNITVFPSALCAGEMSTAPCLAACGLLLTGAPCCFSPGRRSHDLPVPAAPKAGRIPGSPSLLPCLFSDTEIQRKTSHHHILGA
uniref:Ig-like domain-containing protein n=1 Tax=Pavo cristatus TaxID=9049 RepID=A0A8C9L9C0_PAVCR